jgi:2',3'-cyclic-nucleotide 2'-phosphodiesterase (5'-nucleotidase family)
MTVTYDLEQPIGQRVVAVEIGGRALDPAATYTVTTFDFLASGADLYSGFLDAEVIIAQGPEFAELLESRFAEGDSVPEPEDGRLIPLR